MSELLLFVVFAHYIGDFALQSEWVAINKATKWYVLFAHAMIWTGVISAVLYAFGALTVGKVALLLVGHIVTDKWKTMMPADDWWYIYPDQFVHLWQCFMVAVVM